MTRNDMIAYAKENGIQFENGKSAAQQKNVVLEAAIQAHQAENAPKKKGKEPILTNLVDEYLGEGGQMTRRELQKAIAADGRYENSRGKSQPSYVNICMIITRHGWEDRVKESVRGRKAQVEEVAEA